MMEASLIHFQIRRLLRITGQVIRIMDQKRHRRMRELASVKRQARKTQGMIQSCMR